jgi:hypothetical protein
MICHYAECHIFYYYAERHAECRYAECRYTECRSAAQSVKRITLKLRNCLKQLVGYRTVQLLGPISLLSVFKAVQYCGREY